MFWFISDILLAYVAVSTYIPLCPSQHVLCYFVETACTITFSLPQERIPLILVLFLFTQFQIQLFLGGCCIIARTSDHPQYRR